MHPSQVSFRLTQSKEKLWICHLQHSAHLASHAKLLVFQFLPNQNRHDYIMLINVAWPTYTFQQFGVQRTLWQTGVDFLNQPSHNLVNWY